MTVLEKELKRYFIMNAIVDTTDESGIGMYSKDVDNLWHSFLLLTKDYADFCTNYIRYFVNHVPESHFFKPLKN